MPDQRVGEDEHTHYAVYSREDWTALGAGIAQPLTDNEIRQLRGVNEDISADEVAAIYLPVARLLNLQIVAAQQLHRTTASFFQTPAANVPFVIGVAGSVAVGKSTTARILQALLARWPDHPTVDLVTTDGFLLPNAALEERGLAARKGFPESYDWGRLRRFVEDVKLGAPAVQAPIYSHLRYDIVPDEFQVVRQPNVLILEGINILQGDSMGQHGVVDLLDASVYIDADEGHILQWFVQRFLRLCETAFHDPNSYFHHFTGLTTAQAVAVANGFWTDINGVNLRDYIAPTRKRARLVLTKGADHAVERVLLRML